MAITINNIDELIAFSTREDKGASDNYLDVELTADIDFATDNDGEYYFYNWAGCTGTWYINFNGNGHTIKNIFYDGNSNWGFFNLMYGTIENLSLKEISISAKGDKTGGICGVMENGGCVINNCHVTGHIKTANQQCGGICGFAKGRISNCTFSGRLETASTYLGGITYTYGNNLQELYNCAVKADIVRNSTSTSLGGVLCSNRNDQTTPKVTRCYFIGTLQSNNSNKMYAIYNGVSSECYAAVKASNATVAFCSKDINTFYDSTVAETAGYTVENGIGATTSQLQDISWLQQQGWSV